MIGEGMPAGPGIFSSGQGSRSLRQEVERRPNMKKALLIGSIMIMLTAAFAEEENPLLIIQTNMGNITVEVFSEKAAVTAANFLRYVDGGLFEDASFYRVVRMDNQPNNEIKIEVIQGGITNRNSQRFPPISHETTDKTGVLHKDGTISMARGAPGTASSEFFICIGDQPELDFGGLRNPDGQGFAAFGKVREGMDIVKKIQRLPDRNQYLPEPVVILDIVRAEAKKYKIN
jgi:peptidyl-prolyl cis-trans isomerase A (cyclophilin A)